MAFPPDMAETLAKVLAVSAVDLVELLPVRDREAALERLVNRLDDRGRGSDANRLLRVASGPPAANIWIAPVQSRRFPEVWPQLPAGNYAVSGAIDDQPLKAVDQRAILATRDKLRDRPHAANNFVKAMRGLYGWSMSSEEMARKVGRDPSTGVKLLAGKNDDAGFHAWTEEEVSRFEAHWSVGTRQRLAFDILLYTGLRRGDAVRLGPAHVRDGEFNLRTEKTGMVVIAPILPALAASITAAQTGELAFIATERGTPFTKESFGTWFGKVCREAKCPGSAHGLRKAGARRAAEDGATEAQLNALFG